MALRGQRATAAVALLAFLGHILLTGCHKLLDLPIRPIDVMSTTAYSSSATIGNYTGRQGAPQNHMPGQTVPRATQGQA